MSEKYSSFAENIKKIRYLLAKQRGRTKVDGSPKPISREQLAQEIGRADSTIEAWETGKRDPDTAIIEKICSLYGLDKEKLLFGEITALGRVPLPEQEEGRQIPPEGGVVLENLTAIVADCRKTHEILQELVSREGEKLGHIDSILRELGGAKHPAHNKLPILGMAPTLLYVVDPIAKTNSFISPWVEDFLGKKAEEITRLPSEQLMELVDPEGRKRYFQALDELAVAEDGTTREVVYKVQNKRGEWHTFQVELSAYVEEEGGKEKRRVIGIGQDLTGDPAVRKAEELVEELRRRK